MLPLRPPFLQRVIWNNGMRDYLNTSIHEMGAMGVGVHLYFWIVQAMAVFFASCALAAVPALVLNREASSTPAAARPRRAV